MATFILIVFFFIATVSVAHVIVFATEWYEEKKEKMESDFFTRVSRFLKANGYSQIVWEEGEIVVWVNDENPIIGEVEMSKLEFIIGSPTRIFLQEAEDKSRLLGISYWTVRIYGQPNIP